MKLTGAQYLLNRIADLEGTVATLLDQKAAVEKERDALKAEHEKQPHKSEELSEVAA